MSQVMVERIKNALENPTQRSVWLDIPEDIAWIPCPNCSLPFKPGGKLLLDTETRNGCCEGCVEDDEEPWELPF